MKLFALIILTLFTKSIIAQINISIAKEIIKKEINTIGINYSNFDEYIYFIEEKKEGKKSTTKKFCKNWCEIEKLFRETDYIINSIEQNNSNKNCFEVYNHKHKIIITLNSNYKIIEVHKVFIELPFDAPKEE